MAWPDWLVIAALLALFLKNYWVSEDAYLAFRSVEQLLAGHGPIWNPHERVQVYTSPLWFWMCSGAQALLGDNYLAVLVLGTLVFLFSLVLLRQLSGSSARFFAAALVMAGSSACFDYTSSGMENGLAYALLTWHLLEYLACFEANDHAAQPHDASAKHLQRSWLATGLLLVTRHDLALIVAPTTLYSWWKLRRRLARRQAIAAAGAALAPLLAWSLFSLVYYGSPLPNTAYAKLFTGFGLGLFVQHGLDYLWVLARYDTLSALMLVAACLSAWIRGPAPLRVAGVSIALHVSYVIAVGGDYMQGRFISYSCWLAVIVLALQLPPVAGRRPQLALAGGLLAYALLYPRTPLNTLFAQPKDPAATRAAGREFVMDARGTFGQYTSLHRYLRSSPGETFPRHPLALAGRRFAHSDQRVAVVHAAGMFGFTAGLSKIVIEAHGIADPLLARLPASVFAGVGHYIRYRPEGYVAGLERGEVRIEDPDLRRFYMHLRRITQSPDLFSWRRLKTIALMNLGAYDHLREPFIEAKIRGKQVIHDMANPPAR